MFARLNDILAVFFFSSGKTHFTGEHFRYMPTHRAKHSQLGGTQSKQKKAETFEGSIFFF